jgi:phosphatidylglycerophosphatase A
MTTNKPALLLATWFGCGYSPVAPGTAGSLGALLPVWVLVQAFPVAGWVFLIPTLVLLVPSIRAATIVAERSGRKDPGLVVVDEVLGMWVTLAGATHWNWKSWLGAFLLFRLLDIWKPYPARNLEALPAGTGIVADDLMAGAYGALVLFLAGWFNLY